MGYGKIFTRSWEVFWKHKILWLFGLLSGVLKEITIPVFTNNPLLAIGSGELSQWSEGHAALIRGGLLLASFLSLLLGAFATAGIILGNLRIEEGRDSFSFKEISKAVKPYFWRVLGINILLGVVGIGFELLGFASVAVFFGMPWLIPLICILAPVLSFFTIVLPQAPITIIAEDLNFGISLKRAWRLVTGRIGPYLLVWLVVMVITFTMSSILSIPSPAGSGPVSPLESLNDYLQDPTAAAQPAEKNIVWDTVWDRVESLLMGVVGVLVTSIWVQTYLEVRRKETAEFGQSGINPAN